MKRNNSRPPAANAYFPINFHQNGALLPIPTLTGLIFLEIKNIIYLCSENSYTTFCLAENQTIIASRPIHEYEKILLPFAFLRIHNTCLINLTHIRQYIKGEGGQIMMSNKKLINVSRRKKKEFLAILTAANSKAIPLSS